MLEAHGLAKRARTRSERPLRGEQRTEENEDCTEQAAQPHTEKNGDCIEQAGGIEQPGRIEQAAHTEQAGRTEQAAHTERAERIEQAERAEHTEQAEHTEPSAPRAEQQAELQAEWLAGLRTGRQSEQQAGELPTRKKHISNTPKEWPHHRQRRSPAHSRPISCRPAPKSTPTPSSYTTFLSTTHKQANERLPEVRSPALQPVQAHSAARYIHQCSYPFPNTSPHPSGLF